MGEIAEMMLDGTLCSQCGEFLGEPEGYPLTCSSCSDFNESDLVELKQKKIKKKEPKLKKPIPGEFRVANQNFSIKMEIKKGTRFRVKQVISHKAQIQLEDGRTYWAEKGAIMQLANIADNSTQAPEFSPRATNLGGAS